MNGTRRSYGRRWLDAARHPARRDGALLWALLVLPWVVALVLMRRHHHLDVGGWTLVLTASVGLPTLWVTWAAFRDSRRSAAAGGGPDMAQVADELAAAVGKQWGQEAAVRRLNDPYPLPVSWGAADEDMSDAWDLLVQLADITRTWLAMRHRLPWSLMDFLADAHRRGVLRQAGAVYQFRHIDLQHRLAAARPDWATPPGRR